MWHGLLHSVSILLDEYIDSTEFCALAICLGYEFLLLPAPKWLDGYVGVELPLQRVR